MEKEKKHERSMRESLAAMQRHLEIYHARRAQHDLQAMRSSLESMRRSLWAIQRNLRVEMRNRARQRLAKNLTTGQAATLLGVSSSLVRRAVRQGKLQALYASPRRRHYITLEALADYLRTIGVRRRQYVSDDAALYGVLSAHLPETQLRLFKADGLTPALIALVRKRNLRLAEVLDILLRSGYTGLDDDDDSTRP